MKLSKIRKGLNKLDNRLSKIQWQTREGFISITDMKTDHLINTLLMLQSRIDAFKSACIKFPFLKPTIYNERTDEEWINLMGAVLKLRLIEEECVATEGEQLLKDIEQLFV
jgi:hypothetical protein